MSRNVEPDKRPPKSEKLIDKSELEGNSENESNGSGPVPDLWCEYCIKYGGHDTDGHGQNGGLRAGAGRRPGSRNRTTVERAKIKQAMIDRIQANVAELLNAQLTKALGETYLMRKVTERDSKGKVTNVYHEVVTDQRTIIDYLDGELEGNESLNDQSDGDEFYYMNTKPADNQALMGLLDRAFGKADAKVENTGESKLIIETRRHKG